jgi:CelD/BcsL family acetyltransferase involved in cellulose biosynthesis
VTLPPGYDDLVESSADLDRFCSSSDWVVATHACWGRGEPWVAAAGDAAVVLGRSRTRWGAKVLCGLDPVWGFACPVVGADPLTAARLLARVLHEAGHRWDAVLLTGLVPASPRESALLAQLGDRFRVQVGPSMTRQLADLGGGLDAYLQRRSPRFRRNIRQAERRRHGLGIEVELVKGGGAEVVDRCVAVERRTWKGQQGSGLVEDGFAGFYRVIADRLRPDGRLRAGFARLDGRDVGFILGVVRGRAYRGLQLGYDVAFAAASLGNVLQHHQIADLANEGVRSYDLGMDMAYKQHWADRPFTTRTLVITRR